LLVKLSITERDSLIEIKCCATIGARNYPTLAVCRIPRSVSRFALFQTECRKCLHPQERIGQKKWSGYFIYQWNASSVARGMFVARLIQQNRDGQRQISSSEGRTMAMRRGSEGGRHVDTTLGDLIAAVTEEVTSVTGNTASTSQLVSDVLQDLFRARRARFKRSSRLAFWLFLKWLL